MSIIWFTQNIGPNIPPASTTPVQQVLDDTDNIHLFLALCRLLNPFIYVLPIVELTHAFFMVIDDDEGDIFEDDEEEDEWYMFTGQGICHKY